MGFNIGGALSDALSGGLSAIEKAGNRVIDYGAARTPDNAFRNPNPNPSMPNITNPVTSGDISNAQTGVNNSINSTNKLLAALGQAPQNQQTVYGQGQDAYNQLTNAGGVGTQTDATGRQVAINNGLGSLGGTGAMGQAMTQQDALTKQLGGADGVGIQQGAVGGMRDVLGQQQQLANAYGNLAQGIGPNPAQAALNQATGQNVANQAALMAGQRGAGANVGLMARQAAQQGAATQQQAVGQGATMQAQQQLAAMQALSGQQQAMGGTNQSIAGIGAGITGQQQGAINTQYGQGAGVVGQQQTGVNQQFGQGATTVGEQQHQYDANAGVVRDQMGNIISVNGQATNAALGNQGQVLGAAGQYNTAVTGGQASVNAGNTAMNTTKMQGTQGIVGGALNSLGPIAQGIGSAISGGARGGVVQKHYDDGGAVFNPTTDPSVVQAPSPNQQGPQSSFGQFLMNQDAATAPKGKSGQGGAASSGALVAAMMAAKGGVAQHDFRGGGKVKAESAKEKAVKPGNSYANDKVKALLSEGEVVLPRSVMGSQDPAAAAAKFVAQVLAKRGKK